ncbi:hypothetical protein RB599_007515 [Gaeumannomyces hyphopodioides]
MGLQVIYVTRHGYTATIRSPTGIANDPALTAHGLDQARELGRHLLTVEPPIERIYSSPFYRCLQTIEPFARAAQTGSNSSGGGGGSSSSSSDAMLQPPPSPLKVRVESGVAEWFGAAPFAHPSPAPLGVLAGLFPDMLDEAYRPEVVPPSRGESIAELHDRVALAAARIIERCDGEGARSVVICTHAAAVIALGRVLTGHMPDDVVGADDFGAFTCGLSVYRRRAAAAGPEEEGEGGGVGAAGEEETASARDARATAAKAPTTSDDAVPVGTQKLGDLPTGQKAQLGVRQQESAAAAQEVRSSIPRERVDAWMGGRGVGGGWICESNSDCSFLSGGCERGWSFAGEESFPDAHAVSASSVREERRTTRL